MGLPWGLLPAVLLRPDELTHFPTALSVGGSPSQSPSYLCDPGPIAAEAPPPILAPWPLAPTCSYSILHTLLAISQET